MIIFLNGRVNGLVLKQNEVKTITITPGTVYERYIGETKNHHELDIIESEDGAGFDGLKGCLAALQEGDLIKGIILKENEIFGIISGKQEFKQNDI